MNYFQEMACFLAKWSVFFLKEEAEGETEGVVVTMKTDLVLGRHVLGKLVGIGRIIGDALGDVVQSQVVAEVEEHACHSDGHTQCEAHIQGVKLFGDVVLFEVLKDEVAFAIEVNANLGTDESSHAVVFVLDEVVAIEHRKLDAVGGGGNGTIFGRSAFFGQGLLKGEVALGDAIGGLGLQKVTAEVDAHEEGTEIAQLVGVLHLLYLFAIDNEVGSHEKGGVETSLDAKVDYFIGWLFLGQKWMAQAQGKEGEQEE